MALDRATTARAEPAWVAQRLADPESGAVFASSDGVLVTEGETPRILRRPLGELAAAGVAVADPQLAGRRGGVGPGRAGLEPGRAMVDPILLGLEQGRAIFAVDLDAVPRASAAALSRGAQLLDLRAAGALMPRDEGGLAAYLTSLLNWHRTHHFCPNCGTAAEIAEAGYSRRCSNCGKAHFPRTDPVVIMLVASGDRLLFGRHANWPPHRYSVLAGYVAPGERLEEAVAREVREESGVEVLDPRYVASQPWPFPSSLMIGFEAHSRGEEPTASDGELEDVRWFTLEQAQAALRGQNSELELPGRVAIARLLIERWVAARLG